MPKTLVIACDGTWNTPDQRGAPTNVTKMARAIAPQGTDGALQLVYYHEGVGTGNVFDRFVGGTLGVGLGKNVQQAYRYLALNYEPGDRIAMFGFSRGAFTARSLAGLVNLVGILRKGDLDKMVEVWNYYRTKPDERRDVLDPAWTKDRRPRVDLLGVWDTVGALGIPGNLLGRIGRRRHEFHDVTLGPSTRRAYQALAIDEHRRRFVPAIWDTSRIGSDQEVEQVWFAGAHSNVGGGYTDAVLSDQAFLWMVAKSRALLAFDEDYIKRRARQLEADKSEGVAIDAAKGFWSLLGRTYRSIGQDKSESVHPSARARYDMGMQGDHDPLPYEPYPYSPRNLKAYFSRTGDRQR